MKRILLPTDFSKQSTQAAHYALHLAQDLGAEVLLFHAYFDPLVDGDLPTFMPSQGGGGHTTVVMRSAETDARRNLERLVSELRIEFGSDMPLKSRMEYGFADRLISEVATEEACDLIVMGTRGQNSFLKSLLGSVTASVMKQSIIPVLAIPEGYTYKGIEHVMYASDFDPADGWVVRQMLEALKPMDFDLYSIYVYNDHGHPYRKEDYVGLRAALESHMNYVMPEGKMEIIATGDRDLVEGLRGAMEDKNVDLLVMTKHARNFIERLLHPSATRKMLDYNRVPLMVYQIEP